MRSATQTIPLFPIDVVLFPNMVLPLHIFEPRYQKMVRDCLTSGEPFGLIWSENEPLELLPDQPLVGTKAMMTDVVPLPDGRFNINAVGGERFLVRNISFEEPYLTGHIEPYPVVGADLQEAQTLAEQLMPFFDHYVELLSLSAEQDVELDPIPDDPTTLAFAVATLYQCQNYRKQELLAVEAIPDLLKQEIELLRLENRLVQQALDMRDRDAVIPLIGGALAVYSFN